MILDTSAIIAIALKEPGFEALLESPCSALETTLFIPTFRSLKGYDNVPWFRRPKRPIAGLGRRVRSGRMSLVRGRRIWRSAF